MDAALQPGPAGWEGVVRPVPLWGEAVDSARSPAFECRRGSVTILDPMLARARGERAVGASVARAVSPGVRRAGGGGRRMERGQRRHDEEHDQRQALGPHQIQPTPPRVPLSPVQAGHRTVHPPPSPVAVRGPHGARLAPMVRWSGGGSQCTCARFHLDERQSSGRWERRPEVVASFGDAEGLPVPRSVCGRE
jgi:hypothetical protein